MKRRESKGRELICKESTGDEMRSQDGKGMVMFAASREDGRSDPQVLFDAVCDADTEAIFTYGYIAEVLKEGLNGTTITKSRVYQAVTPTNKMLLRERRKYLGVVRMVGYRIIRSDEHLPTAIRKKTTAEGYLSRGLMILENTDMAELTTAHRNLHEGQMMVIAGVTQAIRASEKRHAEQEQAISALKTRVEKLEVDPE
jgi:hypothetical protein